MTSIAIIMFCQNNIEFEKLTKKINKKYSLKHNYDFYCFDKIPKHLINRASCWCHLYYILEILQNKNKFYQYVLFIDSNTFICNHNKRIEDWITNDKNIYIGLDNSNPRILKFSTPTSVISNIIILKNTKWCIQFLHCLLIDLKFKEFWKYLNGVEIVFRKCLLYNFLNIKQNITFIRNFNFNSYNNNLNKYITNGGWGFILTNENDVLHNVLLAKEFIKINKLY